MRLLIISLIISSNYWKILTTEYSPTLAEIVLVHHLLRQTPCDQISIVVTWFQMHIHLFLLKEYHFLHILVQHICYHKQIVRNTRNIMNKSTIKHKCWPKCAEYPCMWSFIFCPPFGQAKITQLSWQQKGKRYCGSF